MGDRYSGCLINEPENPFMGSDSPVELMLEERVWEVPAVPALPPEAKGGAGAGGVVKEERRKSRMSLWFDGGVGVWVPRK
jgi:hypothetical protein